jgi:hypothetical protein
MYKKYCLNSKQRKEKEKERIYEDMKQKNCKRNKVEVNLIKMK